MPFQAYASYFSLERLKAMRSAYAAALNDLSVQALTVPPDKVPALKGKLAQLILASACNRKREADELKEIALPGSRTGGRLRSFFMNGGRSRVDAIYIGD